MIVFDLQALQSAAYGERGIARYTLDLARALERRHAGLVDAYVWNDLLDPVERLDEFAQTGRLRSFSEVRGQTVDVLHVNSPHEPLDLGDFLAPVRARRTVVTCYDLIPYRFPERYLADPSVSARYTSRLGLLASADAIVTDSISAADDVHRLLGVSEDRLTVIGGGVSDVFVPPETDHTERLAELQAALPGLEDGYVLAPSGMDWRKNPLGAIAAYAALPRHVIDEHQLVLACRVNDAQRDELEQTAAQLDVADRLIVPGYIEDDTLVRLYQTADVVMFLSKYEGFGLPVLEARRCGARVICSNTSSLPEVLTDPRAQFNPWDPDQITLSLYRSLTDERFRTVLDDVPDPGLDWPTAADRLAHVYRTIRPAPATVTVAAPPRRLAVVSPLPPTPSGVADHSDRLVRAMVDLDDVDPVAFVPRHASAIEDVVPYPVHDIATLPARWAAGDFDAVLYCFGNHAFHASLFPMMKLVPGAVLLHDIRLTGVYPPGRPPAAEGDFWALPIVRRATTVMVQSEHAAELLVADTGIDPIRVGPLHCAVTDATARDPADDPDVPVIVSAGIAGPTKRTDVVAAAMRELASRRPARGALVGLGGEVFTEPDDPIEVTGPVSDSEFDAWLRRSSVLVQLRGTTNGESSGVVSDALGRGCVVVVSDFGAMSEFPDDVVVKVAPDVNATELADLFAVLIDDAEWRADLSANALAYAAAHTPAVQAGRIVRAIFG